ncbi:MAG: sulfatase [Bacteroidota bacterium]
MSRLLLLILLLVVSACAPAEPDQPNILWLTVEDLSARLPMYGDATVATPALSRLAEEGVVFEHLYATYPVCSPNRSSIITGQYPNAIGTMHMRTGGDPSFKGGIPTYEAVPPPHVKAFPELLRAAGYYASNNVKTDYQFGEPFTIWDETSTTATWQNRAEGQPFFSVFNFTGTHESRAWPQETSIDLVKWLTGSERPDTLDQRYADLMAAEAPPLQTDPASVPVPPYYPDTPTTREHIARYYDNIVKMDAWVGAHLDSLEAAGLLDETIVVFFSDHGDGLPRGKRWLYDSGLHMPMIVRWPDGRGAGTRRSDLVSVIDLAPTMLSLASAARPERLPGRVFLGDSTEAAPRYVFGGRDRMDEAFDRSRFARSERFKYIRNDFPEIPYSEPSVYRDLPPIWRDFKAAADAGTLTGPPAAFFAPAKPAEELYDTAADSHEVRNLAGDPAFADTLAAMRNAVTDWLLLVGDRAEQDERAMIETMWPDGEQPQTPPPVVTFMEDDAGAQVVKVMAPMRGSSIGYRHVDGDYDSGWQVYTAPLPIATGRIHAKAIRYGYQESRETVTYLSADGLDAP